MTSSPRVRGRPFLGGRMNAANVAALDGLKIL